MSSAVAERSAIELDLAEIRSVVAANASAVDRAELPASWLLPELAQRGLLDSGVEDVANLAHLIDTIAQEDLATAFSVWAHRMVLEYLTRAERSPFIDEELAELRTGARVGSTAMASGVKALAGIEALPVTATRDGDGLRLDGVIPWASNLTANGTVVLPAGQVGAPPIAVALRLDTPGITRRDVRGLLALEATASGSLQLSGVRVDPAAVLSRDLGTLVRGFRPTFLILQSSFALGLARRAVAEAKALDHRPDQLALRPQVQAITAALARHTATRDRLAAAPAQASDRELLTLRLDVVELAVAATRLESTLTGGRGYLASSPTARRLREAAFLPIQSPSEGHLRWELSSLASTA
ncbi:MAG: acyl-CoA/acyl-ACP dehydrogenase [Dermatophilaceae bacterium]|nr:acyl-CoA/acyl-ACP dehydrogenase [Dermatophilaceae bacterium]MBP9919097.1 acyl-CoA/acyl-ACP dehydrogenase [Dermatophilaceae bacterium]